MAEKIITENDKWINEVFTTEEIEVFERVFQSQRDELEHKVADYMIYGPTPEVLH